MTHYSITIEDKMGVSDDIQGTYRKVIDVGTEDIVIARFWVQPFRILEKTSFADDKKQKIQKVLYQLAEDMLSLRGDIMSYSKEVTRYFEGVKSGEFYEKKGNIEYFKEVFHGKKIVEDFYFHAELCKRDAYRLLKMVEPDCPNWAQMWGHFKKDHFNYGRIASVLQFKYEDLCVIREIRGVIEHGDDENDFEITDIRLEQTEKGIAFHQPYFQYPKSVQIKGLDCTEKEVVLENVTVIDLLDKHFWSIHNICENFSVLPLMKYLDHAWEPRLLSIQNYDPECPVQWIVEPAQNPRRTVNALPT